MIAASFLSQVFASCSVRALVLCWQAAVKALRGAQYARDANRNFQLDDVRNLTDGFDDNQHLSSWASELQGLNKSSNRLLYPTDHSSMNIPHDVITEDMCQTARELCSSIVSWCQAFINKWYKPFTISRATTISSILKCFVLYWHVGYCLCVDCVIRRYFTASCASIKLHTESPYFVQNFQHADARLKKI